ncbi:methyltransferase domain-containing protein [Clostridium peptidivorans]|uniref:methyltransferase domain-containing protein n=1 Tax=Clostridium peptidivorans TaxID=100174 RepID=UPI000BE23922|nr:methyltransferase domain-containing protein [Clostridium peptidivorans]
MKDINYTNLIEDLKTSDDKQRAEIIDKLSKDYNNTMPLLWREALNQENPRAILSVIRDMIKKEKPRGIFKRAMGNSKQKLGDFLKHSDPKVRKNVCSIIGEIGDSEYLEPLYSSYASEEQLFVKSSYILAIGNCGGVLDAERLTKILEDLTIKEKASEDKSGNIKDEKHINEEKRALTRAIAKLSPRVKHEFIGFKNPVPMILTTMNDHFQTTLMDLNEKLIKGQLVTEGIYINEKDFKKIYRCRTFYETLFPLESCTDLELDYKSIATEIINADIVNFLNQCHAGDRNNPFWYRVEFKTMDHNRERSEFVKNLSRELDEISGGNLKNSPSSYEVEIRIVEKNNLCSVFIKLYTLKDNRFDYREKDLPTSINPVTAAIVMKSIARWLKPNAKVIDPFCGVGTMLIERAKLKDFQTLTGVDIFNTGITYAAINSELANVKIELIAEDILEFSSRDLFDEMISNMPFESKAGASGFNKKLYSEFVNRIPSLVRPGGMAFLYTVEKNLLKQNLIGNKQLKIIDTIKIETGGLIPYVFVIKVR